MKRLLSLLAIFAVLPASACQAFQTVAITGGQSTATLFEDDLATVGLVISGFSDDVSETSDGTGSFALNDRDDPARPTTFEYTPSGDMGLFPVSGRGEHTGSVLFAPNPLGINSIGNFSIGYDASRESDLNSGFFIESTTGLQGILFDILSGSDSIISTESQISVEGRLGISPELNAILPVSFDVTGVAVGTWSFNGTATGLAGDLNNDDLVDCGDIDQYIGNLDVTTAENRSDLDLNADENIDSSDVEFLIMNLVVTDNGQTGTFLGDLNCDGQVNVLGDALTLVVSLGESVTSYRDGDIDLDGSVTVLGDALSLVLNLGRSNN